MANYNYMKDVAKMLGVELGEQFNIDCCGECSSDNSYIYHLSNDGVVLDKKGYSCISADVLSKLILGEWKIKRIPWHPNSYEMYYFVNADGDVDNFTWAACTTDLNLYKLGNCYRTPQEAEANRDKWIAFYASDEMLEVNNYGNY